jgi:hypothetical protein
MRPIRDFVTGHIGSAFSQPLVDKGFVLDPHILLQTLKMNL